MVSGEDHDIQCDEQKSLSKAAQAINALSLIYREAVRSKCNAEEFGKTLSLVSSLNSSSCTILERVWSKFSSTLLSSSKVSILDMKPFLSFDLLTPLEIDR